MMKIEVWSVLVVNKDTIYILKENRWKEKLYINPNSKESLNDRRVFGGNSDGMINFTRK